MTPADIWVSLPDLRTVRREKAASKHSHVPCAFEGLVRTAPLTSFLSLSFPISQMETRMATTRISQSYRIKMGSTAYYILLLLYQTTTNLVEIGRAHV